MNFLEELAAEWYEWRGYFVRRNVKVGRRQKGGWDGELDVVALNPRTRHLVHIECSMDASPWAERERRFARKFKAGRDHIPRLFEGMELPAEPEQVALLGFASKRNRQTVGGAPIVLVEELMRDIVSGLSMSRVATAAIPEDKPLLRALQFASEHRKVVFGLHGRARGMSNPELNLTREDGVN